MQNKMNKRIIVVLSFLMTLFVLLVLYLTYFQIVKADKIANNEYNKRLWVDEDKVERGTIYDRDKNVLVETKKDSAGKNYRFFDYADIYGNITGYNSKTYGTAGLEKSYIDNKFYFTKTCLQFARRKERFNRNDESDDWRSLCNGNLSIVQSE